MRARRRTLRRIPLLVACWIFAPVADARADWLVTPFLGATFGTETAFLDLGGATQSKHRIFGGSGGWLSDGVFGVEADLAFAPGFFEDDMGLIVGSRVTTVSGNVIAAVPLTVSRESLRPYLLAGLGVIQVNIPEPVGLVESNGSLGLQLGGGAIGFLTDRTGVRFDLRQVRSLRRTADEFTFERRTKLSFWRATVGVTFRY
jgi:hypothetical protein